MTLPDARLLTQAAAKFNLDPASLEFIRQAANAVYSCTREGQPCILRLTPAEGRDRAMILAELDFMDAVGRNGGSVPKVYRSVSGALVEAVSLGSEAGAYFAAVFERVPGEHPEGAAVTDEFLRLWGRTLGRMHRLSTGYRPGRTIERRPDWHEMDMFQIESLIPEDQVEVLALCTEHLDMLEELPTDPDGYGLIHADPEPWNIFLHGDRITLIDFDDCCYHWFAFDVAVAVMYAYYGAQQGESPRADLTPQHTWDEFYAGYRAEYTLSEFWRAQIPALLRLRVMEDYAFNYLAWDMADLEDWQREMMAYQRQLIETGALPVMFDPTDGA